MSKQLKAQLSQDEWRAISSAYLAGGIKQEAWEIGDVDIRDAHLKTVVRMTKTYLSPTDDHGFHLSFITCLEFLSQLQIIYVHAWAGLQEKKREGWMLESQTRNKQAIRDPEHIEVDMTVKSIRKIGDLIYTTADFVVTDRQGGLFEVHLKAMLS